MNRVVTMRQKGLARVLFFVEGSESMAKKKTKFIPTRFMAEGSYYDEEQQADYVVNFIQCLCHTKGKWAGKPFILLPWQEEIIRNIFGILKADGKRQFTTAYIEIPKKNGKSELAAAVALYLLFGDGEASQKCTVQLQTDSRHPLFLMLEG